MSSWSEHIGLPKVYCIKPCTMRTHICEKLNESRVSTQSGHNTISVSNADPNEVNQIAVGSKTTET